MNYYTVQSNISGTFWLIFKNHEAQLILCYSYKKTVHLKYTHGLQSLDSVIVENENEKFRKLSYKTLNFYIPYSINNLPGI